MRDKGEIFADLVHIADKAKFTVKLVPFKTYYGRLKGDRIGLANWMDIDDLNYNLAHELAHAYLHYDKGDTINSDKNAEYEEQADRAAKLLLDALAL